jgi:dGTPase
MRSNLKSEAIMTDIQKKDFLYFDGNVQNLRILTKLQMLNDENGVNFTYATLASLIKYPWDSNGAETKPSKEKPKGKYGYYQSEKEQINKIWDATGLSEGIRHPATYLLEAADDIIYTCDDIEDGVKKGEVNWEIEFKKLKDKFTSDFFKSLFLSLDRTNSKMRDDIPDKVSAYALNFRNSAQGFMFNHAVNNFMDNYSGIMNGEMGIKELLDFKEMTDFIEHLKGIAKNSCFNCKEVLTLELVGDKVIKGLLNIFISAMIETIDIEDTRIYAGKLYHIISSNFRYIANFDYSNKRLRSFKELTLYEKMQLITDYISGMTDSYAVNLYKELTGYKLP